VVVALVLLAVSHVHFQVAHRTRWHHMVNMLAWCVLTAFGSALVASPPSASVEVGAAVHAAHD
jgi:hypothetical protein